jgi:Family of unknown function (DUF5767)
MARPKNNIIINKIPNTIQSVNVKQSFPAMPILYLEFLENKNKVKSNLQNVEYSPVNKSIEIEELESDNESDKISDKIESEDENNEKEEKEESEKDTEKDEKKKRKKDKKHKKNKKDKKHKHKSDSSFLSSNDNLEDKLKDFYDNDKSISVKSVSVNEEEPVKVEPKVIPRLSQLSKQMKHTNEIVIPDTNNDDEKRELLYKFELLRKGYKNNDLTIPSYTIHSDYNEIKREYDNTLRHVHLDSSVSSNKKYLAYGFMGVEYIFSNYLNFDMRGFTKEQLSSMATYDNLLIELGEKSYVPNGKNWPVEVRLIGVIVSQALFFIVSKKIGIHINGLLSGNGGNVNTTEKRRMRPPEVELDN